MPTRRQIRFDNRRTEFDDIREANNYAIFHTCIVPAEELPTVIVAVMGDVQYWLRIFNNLAK